MCGLHRARQRQKRRQPGAIVGDSRRAHARAIAMDLHVRAGGKNGIQMRRDDYDFLFVGALQFADHVAGLIDLNGKPCFRQQWLDGSGARRFLKSRRWDSR